MSIQCLTKFEGSKAGLGVSIFDPIACGYPLGQDQMSQYAESNFFQKQKKILMA